MICIVDRNRHQTQEKKTESKLEIDRQERNQEKMTVRRKRKIGKKRQI